MTITSRRCKESMIISDRPEHYERMKRQYPEFMSAYETLGEAAKKAGPLDARTAALVKLALTLAGGPRIFPAAQS